MLKILIIMPHPRKYWASSCGGILLSLKCLTVRDRSSVVLLPSLSDKCTWERVLLTAQFIGPCATSKQEVY